MKIICALHCTVALLAVSLRLERGGRNPSARGPCWRVLLQTDMPDLATKRQTFGHGAHILVYVHTDTYFCFRCFRGWPWNFNRQWWRSAFKCHRSDAQSFVTHWETPTNLFDLFWNLCILTCMFAALAAGQAREDEMARQAHTQSIRVQEPTLECTAFTEHYSIVWVIFSLFNNSDPFLLQFSAEFQPVCFALTSNESALDSVCPNVSKYHDHCWLRIVQLVWAARCFKKHGDSELGSSFARQAWGKALRHEWRRWRQKVRDESWSQTFWTNCYHHPLNPSLMGGGVKNVKDFLWIFLPPNMIPLRGGGVRKCWDPPYTWRRNRSIDFGERGPTHGPTPPPREKVKRVKLRSVR